MRLLYVAPMLRSVQGAAWVAALAALWAYALTLSPTVAWVNLGEDSGDLLAASATLGIPHPTGYPLFVLLGRLATFLPLGTMAFRINLIAAFLAAILWLLVEAERERDPRRLLLAGYLFGLGLTNHLLVLAAGLPIAVVTWRLAGNHKIGLVG